MFHFEPLKSLTFSSNLTHALSILTKEIRSPLKPMLKQGFPLCTNGILVSQWLPESKRKQTPSLFSAAVQRCKEVEWHHIGLRSSESLCS